ncbi:hypothetical protein [Heyndrickxia ginsengihumi]|uniref:Uncharacterized protein n=1 Tax=Heyndrickxia ginsengihumi TaxID=363870 RepID=A0A0A6VDI9_9BACI|nr:hypothetical protein [Heyndrickxia ginsengihumi]KHD85646.1 hypothetical protein NG54_07675 [Heyndrickxia ginsengihumi]MBE6185380.1 hypothetical protein [Bacillus sp. (in: firmicutes)]MCM3025059.1 hypothetical protein [Heyndrickxia ginsengihumi]NEY20551.1 hypothetical protein [Heyndrickxia ginsengihumi]
MLTKDEFLDKLDTFEMEVGLLENTVIANLKQERVNLIAMHVHQYKNILRKMEHLEHRVNDFSKLPVISKAANDYLELQQKTS